MCMPELPEVKTVAKYLKQNLLDKKVTKIKIIYGKTIDSNSLDINLLIGQALKDIQTKGKYLILDFDKYFLISHLRMEGKYFIKDINDEVIKHEHIIIEFDKLSLRYHDTRKFGRMQLLLKENLSKVKGLNALAPEPFDQEMTKELLFNKLKNKRLPIKSILLDQTIIAGLGNIYVDEVLFASKISPLKLGKDITLKESAKIIGNSAEILKLAIEKGGTTIRSYTSSLGVEGGYQDFLKVHYRVNQKCFICDGIIKKIKVGGRGTYYCPNCQK